MESLFRLKVPILPHPHPITHDKKIMLLGSCFTENIAGRLLEFRFDMNCNPTGILYNPISISSALYRLISCKLYESSDLFFHNGLWHSFDHHSRFSRQSADETLDNINTSLINASNYLKNADYLILTAGSSFTYKNVHSGMIVANCHRLPHDYFEKKLETPESIVENWNELFNALFSINKNLNIILTISPVRHYPSQPRDNQLSKASCILAFYMLEKTFPQINYFPSYEILMDELRDYRFYNKDMVHPSETAIDYIWQRFCDTCISEQSNRFIHDYTPICNALKHRITPESTSENQSSFAQSMLIKIDNIKFKYPSISFEKERNYFHSLLS